MILKQKTFFILFFIALSFVFAINVKAATLTLIPESKIVKIGEEVSIDVKIDTEGESINAVQGTINFPAALLEATKIDRANSVFSFWVEEPTFSNEEGAAKFIGGTSKGVSGKSLQVFKLILKTRGAGSAELTLSDTAITASDGKGTNVLSRAEGVVIAIGATTIAPSPAASPVTQPQKVERIATPATKLPATPAVRVPLYPDVSQWYNYIGETIVLWDVPNDITQVATKLDQNPNTIPVIPEKELSTGKNLGTIKEGIWYIHVRFSNNVGWGSTAHYKLSLDATPPPPFEVKIDNAASDNPSPQITFDAHDALSGISNILV